MRRIASSIEGTPLESTNVTESTDPPLRIATVTIGGVCGSFANSRTVSTGVLNWILRAHASTYWISSSFGCVRPQTLTRRAVLNDSGSVGDGSAEGEADWRRSASSSS